MKFRYFYNSSNGAIASKTRYTGVCILTNNNGIETYIDSDDDIDISQYQVDLVTQTLVLNSDH